MKVVFTFNSTILEMENISKSYFYNIYVYQETKIKKKTKIKN